MLLAADKRAQRSDATIEIHVDKGRHLERVLGRDFDVRRIDAELTAAYTDRRLGEGAGRHTIHKELGTLRRACRVAGVEWQAAWMPELGRFYTPRERWLSIGEYRLLLAALPDHRRDYVIMWCQTGLRESELYKLRASDVDHGAKRLRVRGTKTEKSDRVVPLSPDALEVLRRRTRFEPWGNVGRDLLVACERAEIDRVSPNDLRRTFASWLANKGASPLVVAKLLGHTSTRMVERIYARLGHEVKHETIELLPSVTSLVTEPRGSSDRSDRPDGENDEE